MKILMLRNPSSSLGCELQEGETGNVSKELGGRLVALGIAVEVEVEQKPRRQAAAVTGVAPKPSVAEAKPAEIVGGDKKSQDNKKGSAE
jgi:hypothetical protein